MGLRLQTRKLLAEGRTLYARKRQADKCVTSASDRWLILDSIGESTHQRWLSVFGYFPGGTRCCYERMSRNARKAQATEKPFSEECTVVDGTKAMGRCAQDGLEMAMVNGYAFYESIDSSARSCEYTVFCQIDDCSFRRCRSR